MPLRFLAVLIVFAFCVSAEAQQGKKIPKVGFLGANSASDLSAGIEGFRQGLHEVGYVEKQNKIDYRFGLRGLPGTPMGRRMISHGYVVSFRYSLKNSVGVLLDSLQGRVHFAFKLLANALTEELRDFVSGQKQKPQLAGALKEVSDGEVALKDEVAAVLNLADRIEARKVHRLSLPLREFGPQKKTPIVEPLADQIWAQPIRSRLQCLGVGNGKKSVVVFAELDSATFQFYFDYVMNVEPIGGVKGQEGSHSDDQGSQSRVADIKVVVGKAAAASAQDLVIRVSDPIARTPIRLSTIRSVIGSVEFVAGLGGLAWFIGWAGLKVLRPTRIDWLLSGHDWSQHLMGWLFLRNESWKFPLGRLDNFLYPVGTTIGYTDSTPWVSLLLRPFSSLLPVDFQFIGPWLALCFFLQGAAGAWLAAAFTRDRTARLCSGMLFAASPVLLSRVVHDSLSSQWMIVVLIGLHVRRAADNAIVKRHLSAAFGLTVLSSLTHPYMAMMILGLAVALVIKLVVVDRSLDWTRGLLLGTALPVVSLLIFLLLGYFSGGVAPGTGGFDLYGADMLSFFNPSGRSRFLPNLLQYVFPNLEGAGYLGLGTIVLMIFASIGLVAALADGFPPFHWVWPLGLVSVGFAIYALGPAPKLGNIELLQLNAVYQRVTPLISPFRTAGRFLWIFHYALLAGSIAIVLRSWKGRPWLATAAMVIASVLQLTDVKFDGGNPFDRTRIDAGLHSPLWKSIGAEYRHLALVPPQILKYDSCQGELDGALRWPFAYVAYVQKMTFNSGYVARANDDAIRANCVRFTESVRRGELDTSTLYVVGPETLKALLTASGSEVVCGRVDSYNVCVSGSSQGETRRYLETPIERMTPKDG